MSARKRPESSFHGAGAAAVAATNSGDVVALVGTNVVRIGADGKQTPLPTTISGGAFGIPIGIAYDSSRQLDAALPGAFASPPSGLAGPGGAITPIATHADGLLGAANMTVIHSGRNTVIYIANGESCSFVPGSTTTGGAGPAILTITIPSPTH